MSTPTVTTNEEQALAALHRYQEGSIETDTNGRQWGSVYLDNAKPGHWSGRTTN